MAIITINGFELPDTNLVAADRVRSDIHSSDSGRGETGRMYLSYVRTNVRKISIELNFIADEVLAALKKALDTKPLSVAALGETLTAYNSDINETLMFTDTDGTRYYNVSFSLTEI